MKRSNLAKLFCYGVTICVLLGLSGSTIARELSVLLTGTETAPYPSVVYFVLPVPATAGPANPKRGATGADFSQVYTSATALREGRSAYRKPDGRSTDVFGRPAGYPPLMNWLYVPFVRLRYVDALVLHTAFWPIAFLGVSLLLLFRFGLLRLGLPLTVLSASLYGLTPVGFTHLERGQFDLVVATATVLAMMCVVLPRSQYVAPLITGLLGALKWTAISYLGCFAALGFLVGPNRRRISFALIPVMIALGTFSFWQGVLEYWPTIQKYEIDATPDGLTFEWFLPRRVVKSIPVVLTLLLAALIWLRGQNTIDRRQLLLATVAPYSVALMAASICFGTLSYEYHSVTMLGVVPGLLVWMERAPLVRNAERVMVTLGFACFLPYAFRVYGFGAELQPQTVTLLYGALAVHMLIACTSIVVRASPALHDLRDEHPLAPTAAD